MTCAGASPVYLLLFLRKWSMRLSRRVRGVTLPEKNPLNDDTGGLKRRENDNSDWNWPSLNPQHPLHLTTKNSAPTLPWCSTPFGPNSRSLIGAKLLDIRVKLFPNESALLKGLTEPGDRNNTSMRAFQFNKLSSARTYPPSVNQMMIMTSRLLWSYVALPQQKKATQTTRVRVHC